MVSRSEDTMYKSRSNDTTRGGKSLLGYAEMDPSSRYGRFKDILGKGAMKTVYKAFDEVLAIEVAWNQVKLNDVFRSPEELQRLYSEVHLLKNLNHDSIMRFHTCWIDVERRTFNFITEMFTAGSLREYRQKYKRVHIRAVKNWARQILEGLAYLHSHDPPVIHRDLKCDNIFINGHLGQVKIGDLGLAATLCKSQHAHSVIGTPEFMAPEMYEEDYNELVDIYSFGMCMLEMLTLEYPYSECSNPAQIYKKVTTGKLPKAFYQIEDVEAQRFVGKCLENATRRPSARELLMEPFLVNDNEELMDNSTMPCQNPILIQKVLEKEHSLIANVPKKTTDMTITGSMNQEDGSIFLKVLISDKTGKARNIYFPFDISCDTAQDVATEMVKELEINDWEPFDIAEMIDKEIVNLIPTWKKGVPVDSLEDLRYHSFCYDEEDDDDDNVITPHPLHSLSSSQTSLHNLFAPLDAVHDQLDGIMIFSKQNWTRGNTLNDDDTSSQSSLNSSNYSNIAYNDLDEYRCSSSSFVCQDSQRHWKAKNIDFTRLCGEERVIPRHERRNALPDKTRHTNIKRVNSVVDIRSQLLHRSLVEEIHKRRFFKTVAAIENIGYHEPAW